MALKFFLILVLLAMAGTPKAFALPQDMGGKKDAEPSVMTDNDFIHMSQDAVTAFNCSAIASAGGNDAEAMRLFKEGYERGMLFVSALNKNKIDLRSAGKTVPAEFSVARGPNDDFALGRVYQQTADHVEIFFGGLSPADKKTQAASKYQEMNCASIKTAH